MVRRVEIKTESRTQNIHNFGRLHKIIFPSKWDSIPQSEFLLRVPFNGENDVVEPPKVMNILCPTSFFNFHSSPIIKILVFNCVHKICHLLLRVQGQFIKRQIVSPADVTGF